MGLGRLRELLIDREAWHAAAHGVTKSWTLLSDWTDWSTLTSYFNRKGLVLYTIFHAMSFFFKLFFIEGYLLYRLLLFSVKSQHELAIGIHISHLFWNSFPSCPPPHTMPLGWYRAPVWVSWAIQQIPIGCICYIWWCKFPCHSFHTSPPLLPSPHIHKSIL